MQCTNNTWRLENLRRPAMTEVRMLYPLSQDYARPRTPITAGLCGALVFALAVLLISAGLAVPAEAQLYAGSVTGVVGDQSGALIGIKVDVTQNIGADFTMSVLGTKETVTVSTAAPVLGTEDAVTGQVVDRKFINDLPLNGRDVWNLAFLAPGVTEVDAACMGCSANNFISNGSRNATADILMDGVTTTNYEQNSGIRVDTYTPSVDAVEEFKVQESNFSSEYGFS